MDINILSVLLFAVILAVLPIYWIGILSGIIRLTRGPRGDLEHNAFSDSE